MALKETLKQKFADAGIGLSAVFREGQRHRDDIGRRHVIAAPFTGLYFAIGGLADNRLYMIFIGPLIGVLAFGYIFNELQKRGRETRMKTLEDLRCIFE